MRLLVVAPHSSDAILGCGGLVHAACRSGWTVQVVVLAAPGMRSEAGASAAWAALGAPPPFFWDEPCHPVPVDGVVRSRYLQCVQQFKPSRIALPAPEEAGADQRRLTRGLLAALQGHWRGELLFYEATSALARINHLESIDLAPKIQALAILKPVGGVDLVAHARGLAQMRGAALGGGAAAEAFVQFAWDGSPQNFFDRTPLVSVIVRACDPDWLAIALDSIARQSYDHLEVILVWHGEHEPPIVPGALEAQVVRGPGARSANLNAGLSRARGSLVAFLDQDDVWLEDHLAGLLAELQADAALDVAYSDHQVAHCRRDGAQVQVLGTHEPPGEDWVEGRLLIGNHIPLNAFVCATKLARRIGFDESLDAYEDWDFLARAELQGASFRRVPTATCQYRLYPGGDEPVALTDLHEHRGYLPWADVVRDKLARGLHPRAARSLMAMAAEGHGRARVAQEQADGLDARLAKVTAELEKARAELARAQTWSQLLPGTRGSTPVSVLAANALREGPRIAIVMPVCDPEPQFLAAAIESVRSQSYLRWQLCVADDASTDANVLEVLDGLHADARVRFTRLPCRGGIVSASRAAAELADAEWLAFVDHDDVLHPDALLEIAGALAAHPEWSALYTDSRTIDRNGAVVNSYSKPSWAPETLLHLNYINHLSVVRRELYESLGGLRAGFDGSQDWDLWLRIAATPGAQIGHLAQALYDWRASERSVAYSTSAKPYVVPAAARAVQSALSRRGLADVATRASTSGGGMVSHWRADLQPICAIVPTHNNARDLERLLDSLEAASYPELHVCIVANNVAGDDPAMQGLLTRAATQPHWRVVRDDRPFNWSALNNSAVKGCDAPWLLFLNDDVALHAPDTLERLARYLTLDPAIGAVGAFLTHDEHGLQPQHDGIVTDPRWIARNVVSEADGSGFGVPRNVSAVTGAFMLTRRAAFQSCGGFDEQFAVSFNDVDYCLQLRQSGCRIVQASDVHAVHREYATRGVLDTLAKRRQLESEMEGMRRKWGGSLKERYRLNYDRAVAATRIVRFESA